MSQQTNTYLNMAFAEIEKLKQANEALAARVTQLEQRPTPEPAKTLHLDHGKPGRQQAADGTNRQ